MEMNKQQPGEVELLPCPFDGGKAVPRMHDYRPDWAIFCENRNTTCPVNMRTHYGNLVEVAKEWNTRPAAAEVENERLEKTFSLLREVMEWHSHPASPEYNECDTSPCLWCENALEAMKI